MTPEEIARLPYRPCVGVMLVNADGHVFVGQRRDRDQDAWQMPQGGVEKGEHAEVAALRELGESGCGTLGPWVDRGPEFTAFLIDAGHAAVLHPGDAICLPNNGRLSTAMHSVFCGGPGPNYALSLGLFPAT